LKFPIFAAAVLLTGLRLSAAVAVTTWHNDPGRTGVNANETVLTTANVNSATFGKLYSLPVDGQIYAQPLYVPGVTIPASNPAHGIHNVLYVATENNSVFAFDADSATPLILWQRNFGLGVSNVNGVWQIGILSTPVIDTGRQAIYFVVDSLVNGQPSFSLHALDITTGADKVGSPAVIAGSVPGTGDGSVGGTLTFSAAQNLQRPALLELNGGIFIGFGSHGDEAPYHGWLFEYDGVTLRRLALKCLSPDGYGASIWQSGGGLSADTGGNIYFSTGNGTFNPPTGDYGDSVIKIHPASGLGIASSFTPVLAEFFRESDYDLGAGNVVVIPSSVVQVSPLLLTGGKDGHTYLTNSGNLGGFQLGLGLTDLVAQEWTGVFGHFGGNVFYNNSLYTWNSFDVMRIYSFNGLELTPSFVGTQEQLHTLQNAPALSISANGMTGNGAILWAAHSLTYTDGGNYPGILHAYDAQTGAELWNSNTEADAPGAWAKWVPPTIVNGKVYLATFDSGVAVYGLRAGQ
jgi:hypothetical protein